MEFAEPLPPKLEALETFDSSEITLGRTGRGGSSSNKKKISGGLRNQNNSCFLDALLVCLYHMRELKTHLLSPSNDDGEEPQDNMNDQTKTQTPISTSLARVFTLMDNPITAPLAAKDFINVCSAQTARVGSLRTNKTGDFVFRIDHMRMRNLLSLFDKIKGSVQFLPGARPLLAQ